MMKQIYTLIAIISFISNAHAMDTNTCSDCHDETTSFQSNDNNDNNDETLYLKFAHKIIECAHADIEDDNITNVLKSANLLIELMNMSRIPKKIFLPTAQNIFDSIDSNLNATIEEKLPESFNAQLKKGKEELQKLSLV